MQNELRSEKEVLLTDRQRAILGMMARGMKCQAIVSELGITINTVKYHKKIIFNQLNAASASQEVAIAMSLKLI